MDGSIDRLVHNTRPQHSIHLIAYVSNVRPCISTSGFFFSFSLFVILILIVDNMDVFLLGTNNVTSLFVTHQVLQS